MNTTCPYVRTCKWYSYAELTLTSRSSVAARKASEPPRFVERLGNLNVKENEPFEFVAESTGHPPPMMSWQKDGRHIDRFAHDVTDDCLQMLNCAVLQSGYIACSCVQPSVEIRFLLRFVLQLHYYIARTDFLTLVFSGIHASAFATKVTVRH